MPERIRSRSLVPKTLAATCALVLLGAPLGAQLAFAPATISANHNIALVLAKLDESQSPTYPEEGFIDREGLTDKVIVVSHLMAGPYGPDDWCPLMQEIVDRSLEFFLPGSPAQEAFLRDWSRLRILADCTKANSKSPGA